MISFILVQRDRADLTRQAIASLRRHDGAPHEVIVVDNASTERGAAVAEPGCTLLANAANRGWGAANNQGAAAARGEILFFLNNDTIVTGPLAGPVAEYFEAHPGVGAVGVPLRNADGSPQPSAGKAPSIGVERAARRGAAAYPEEYAGSVDWASGAALAVRRDVYRLVGGFDEEYFLYFEDVDFCRRVHGAGFDVHRIACEPVTHLGGGAGTASKEAWIQVEYRRSQLRYYARHQGRAQNAALHAYLLLKCLADLLRGGTRRAAARRILPLLLRRAGAPAQA